MSVILHGLKLSVFFRKIRIILEEKNINYQVNPLRPNPKTPELLKMNPLGKIPILEHDGNFIPDSTVMTLYLEKAFPDHNMIPHHAAEMAHVLFLNSYADTRLYEGIGRKMYYQRIIMPIYGQECDENLVQEGINTDLPIICDYMENTLLTEKRDSLTGTFSFADASFMSYLSGMRELDIHVNEKQYPKTYHYIEENMQRPSIMKSLEDVR